MFFSGRALDQVVEDPSGTARKASDVAQDFGRRVASGDPATLNSLSEGVAGVFVGAKGVKLGNRSVQRLGDKVENVIATERNVRIKDQANKTEIGELTKQLLEQSDGSIEDLRKIASIVSERRLTGTLENRKNSTIFGKVLAETKDLIDLGGRRTQERLDKSIVKKAAKRLNKPIESLTEREFLEAKIGGAARGNKLFNKILPDD